MHLKMLCIKSDMGKIGVVRRYTAFIWDLDDVELIFCLFKY